MRISAAAMSLYEAIHWGKEPGYLVPAGGPLNVPRETVQLGRLVDVELANGRLVRASDLDGPVEIVVGGKGRRDAYLVTPARSGLKPGRRCPLGEIEAISYRSDKNDGRHTYRHEFEGRRPALALDSQGHLVIDRRGSLYTITWQGFVG